AATRALASPTGGASTLDIASHSAETLPRCMLQIVRSPGPATVNLQRPARLLHLLEGYQRWTLRPIRLRRCLAACCKLFAALAPQQSICRDPRACFTYSRGLNVGHCVPFG